MDDLLKALTNLINTGGALADDALYLFFLMKIAQAFAFVAFARVVLSGIAKCIRVGNETAAKSNYMRVLAWCSDNRGPNSPYMQEILANAKEAFNK